MTEAVILIAGAGSGSGKLAARALALAGHTVHATMRDVDGRNQGRADAARTWAHGADLRPLELDVLPQASCDAAVADERVRIVGLPRGRRPVRTVVDVGGDGARDVLAVAQAVRVDVARRIGIADLPRPTV
ncbi:hypothetical protein [Massilia luteola]|uniref:hypothetical protein n=1 Tax=Massilia luteola TaxID=3081751 RepID=UPI002ACC09E6|nr:hypothetical protein [Massilia sp. Gc5]